MQRMILESSVGHREGRVWDVPGQGATTRNSDSIARSCNEAMGRPKRAIRGVATFTRQVSEATSIATYFFNALNCHRSDQLRILG